MKSYVLLLLLIAVVPLTASAQIKVDGNSFTLSSESSLIMKEFGAVITQQNDDITVRIILPDKKDSGQQRDRLQSGDVILMINGNRLSSIGDLKKAYQAIETGETVKIGVRRGEQRFILRRTKKDLEATTAGGSQSMSFNIGENSSPIPELGFMVTESGGQVKISNILSPLLPEELKVLDLQGANIVSISGKKPTSVEDFKKILGEIKIGQDMELVFNKKGKKQTVTLEKPKSKGKVLIKEEY
ncbi:MAG: PDZ domain-containing protein [Balneolaceae bacterium]|nr:PDZ domain-containing protein [Balneolaceae bacterium]